MFHIKVELNGFLTAFEIRQFGTKKMICVSQFPVPLKLLTMQIAFLKAKKSLLYQTSNSVKIGFA